MFKKNAMEVLEVQMINAAHLLWIIPVCILFSNLIFVFIISAAQIEKEHEAYDKGFKEGIRRAKGVGSITLPGVRTLEEVYDTLFCSNFNTFTQMTNNIIYLCHTSGQLEILYIDDVDLLCQYFDYFVTDIIEEPTYNRLIIKQN